MGRKETPEVMSKLLSKPEPQKKKVKIPDVKDGPMKIFSLRMAVSDWEILKRYFKSSGLDLSNGLRMWIIEKMKAEGLRE